MPKTRQIRGRIKAVANIRRITKTMQMIATARYQAAQRRVIASKPFSRKIAELVGEASTVLTAAGDQGATFTHALMKPPNPPVKRELWLILTSNRGLCGGYNGRVFALALQQLLKAEGREIVVELVGRKGLAVMKYRKRAVATFHGQFTDKPSYEEVNRLAERYMKEFTEGRYDAINVVHTSYVSMSRQEPVVMQLLPVKDPTAQDAADQPAGKEKPKAVVKYDFSPDPESLLNELLPITVKTMLFQAFNEAVLTEQIARMVAMKAATDAAKKMGRALNTKYNRARQAAITTELSEIIAGSAALE